MKGWKKRFLTPKEIAQIEAVFNERFFSSLNKDENISFEGHYTEDGFYLTLILKNEDDSYYYPFETYVLCKDNPNLKALDAKTLLLDFIGKYFEDFFANQRNTYIPIDWTPFTVGDLSIYARGQVFNKKLDKMGDKILEANGFDPNGDCT